MEGFHNVEPDRIARIATKREVFYYANLSKRSLSFCLKPALQTIKHDLDNDKIINMILYVEENNVVREYDAEEIEEMLENI